MPATPTYPGGSVEDDVGGDHGITGVATSIAAFVGYTASGPDNEAVRLGSFAHYVSVFGGLHPESTLSYAISQFFANGGSAACVVRVSRTKETTSKPGHAGDALPGIDELVGDSSKSTGLHALDKVEHFNILCIPDATRAKTGEPGTLDSRVDPDRIFAEALTYCQTRRAFLLVDPPPQVRDAKSAIAWVSEDLAVRHPNAAAYFPRLKVADPLDNSRFRICAPCGVVAGLYARTDRDRGVWIAPAGVEATLVGVQGFACALTHAESATLNSLGLNCFRSFPTNGHVAWSARTLAGSDAAASEWKYIPTRRFALFLEESLCSGLRWVAFEPNAEPLWSKIRLDAAAFMHSLFVQGAFRGDTPHDAYFVKCDAETMTRNDIDRGVVNIIVGFAPLKPAEFVIIQIEQLAGQIEV